MTARRTLAAGMTGERRGLARRAARRAGIGGLIAAACCLPSLAQVPDIPPGYRPMNIDAYCKSVFGPNAQQVLGDRSDGSSWRCLASGTLRPVDMDRLCAAQYGTSMRSQLLRPNDAFTWYCVAESGPEPSTARPREVRRLSAGPQVLPPAETDLIAANLSRPSLIAWTGRIEVPYHGPTYSRTMNFGVPKLYGARAGEGVCYVTFAELSKAGATDYGVSSWDGRFGVQNARPPAADHISVHFYVGERGSMIDQTNSWLHVTVIAVLGLDEQSSEAEKQFCQEMRRRTRRFGRADPMASNGYYGSGQTDAQEASRLRPFTKMGLIANFVPAISPGRR